LHSTGLILLWQRCIPPKSPAETEFENVMKFDIGSRKVVLTWLIGPNQNWMASMNSMGHLAIKVFLKVDLVK
jgi:hypothetical protein